MLSAVRAHTREIDRQSIQTSAKIPSKLASKEIKYSETHQIDIDDNGFNALAVSCELDSVATSEHIDTNKKIKKIKNRISALYKTVFLLSHHASHSTPSPPLNLQSNHVSNFLLCF